MHKLLIGQIHQVRSVKARFLGFGIIGHSFACLRISCSTPLSPDGLTGGYSDNRIDSDTTSVEFRGNGYTSKRKVEMYLLYRCAEVTRDAGYDYFIVLNPSTEAKLGSFSTPGSFSSVTSFSRGSGHARSYFPGQTITFTSYGATTLDQDGRGQKPKKCCRFQRARSDRYMGPQILENSEDAEGVLIAFPTTKANRIPVEKRRLRLLQDVYFGCSRSRSRPRQSLKLGPITFGRGIARLSVDQVSCASADLDRPVMRLACRVAWRLQSPWCDSPRSGRGRRVLRRAVVSLTNRIVAFSRRMLGLPALSGLRGISTILLQRSARSFGSAIGFPRGDSTNTSVRIALWKSLPAGSHGPFISSPPF